MRRMETKVLDPRRAAAVVLALAGDEAAPLSLTVSGGCMAPLAADGARVRLVGTRRRAPRFGDVVLARTPAGLCLHRVVWPPRPTGARALRTMADRATCLDATLQPGDVLAVVADVEQGGHTRAARRRSTALRSLLRAVATKARHGLRGSRCV